MGSPPRARRPPFPGPVPRTSIDRPLDPYASRFILARLDSSSEFLRLHSRPEPLGPGRLPGFRPSSRHHSHASTCARASRASLRSVHRRSQPPDGLLRARAPRLVSSSSRVQGTSRSGGSLPAQQTSLVERSYPRAVGSPGARRPFSASTPDRPRLRGVAPREVAFQRFDSEPMPPAAPLLGFTLLQASRGRREPSLPGLSARGVTRPSLRLRAGPAPPPSASRQRSRGRIRLRTHQPAREFRACVRRPLPCGRGLRQRGSSRD
jgi:hypothetical protein